MRAWLARFADNRLLSELHAQKAANAKLHARLRDVQVGLLESKAANKRQKEANRLLRRERDVQEAQRPQDAGQIQLPAQGERRAVRGQDG